MGEVSSSCRAVERAQRWHAAVHPEKPYTEQATTMKDDPLVGDLAPISYTVPMKPLDMLNILVKHNFKHDQTC